MKELLKEFLEDSIPINSDGFELIDIITGDKIGDGSDLQQLDRFGIEFIINTIIDQDVSISEREDCFQLTWHEMGVGWKYFIVSKDLKAYYFKVSPFIC